MSAEEFKPYPGFTITTGGEEPVVGTSAAEEKPQAESADDAQADESETSEEKEETQDESEEQESESEDEESESDDEEEEEVQPKKKQNRVKKRIGKLAAERDFWREEAMKARTGQKESAQAEAKPEAQKAPQKELDPTAPKLGDFETLDDYIDARDEWKEAKREEQRAAKAKEESFQKAQETFIERAKSYASDKSDWSDRIGGLTGIPMKHDLASVIHTQENGPELLYTLANDPAEFRRLNDMSGLALGREIAKIEMRLETSKAAPKPTIQKTKAPAPISPVSGKAASTKKSLSDPDLSFAEYERIRLEQLKRK